MAGQPHPLLPSTGGMFSDLALRLKLIGRLMLDPRVPPLLKLLPLGSAVYLMIPDLLPGPIDDAAIIWGALYFFVELSPPAVVAEHVRELKPALRGEWEVMEDAPPGKASPDIIDGSFVDDQPQR